MYQSILYALLRIETLFFPVVVRYLSPQKDDRILEIGCNRGRLVQKVQTLAPQTYGVDLNRKAIDSGVTMNLRAMDATSLDFPDASFNKIYSVHTIEHIPDLKKALGEMARVLKSGGRLLLVYPAEPVRGLFAIPSAFLLGRNPRQIHVHKLSPRKIVNEFLGATGLRPVESKYMLFPLPPQYLTVLEKE